MGKRDSLKCVEEGGPASPGLCAYAGQAPRHQTHVRHDGEVTGEENGRPQTTCPGLRSGHLLCATQIVTGTLHALGDAESRPHTHGQVTSSHHPGQKTTTASSCLGVLPPLRAVSPHAPSPKPQAQGALTSGSGRRLALQELCRAATSLYSAKSKQTARCVAESLQA